MKTILTMLSLLCSLWFAPQQIAAQLAAPEQKGEFDIGFEIFDADPHEARDLSTPLWYPVAPGTEGNPLIYTHGGLPYESPFFGGVLQGTPSSAGPFPLVVLSHGSGAWGIQFAHLAESLASHGYVVAAPWHRTDDLPTRGQQLSTVVDAIRERSRSIQDPLFSTVNTESISLGGYSLGVAAVREALATQTFEPDALLLIEGLASIAVDAPVLAIGGGGPSSSNTLSSVQAPSGFALNVGEGNDSVTAHHWSFGMNGCQFRHKLVEAGASEEEALQAVGSDEIWLGCEPGLIPLSEVQQRMNSHVIAFLDQTLKADDTFSELLTIEDAPISNRIHISLSMDSDARNEGLSFLLTDPLGRSVGVDPVTGEKIDDFGRDSSATTVLRPTGWVTLQEAALVSGEYTLTAAGHNLSQERAYEIQLTRSAVRGDDVVSERTTIREGIIMPDGAIEPVRFSLFVPEPSATSMVAWGILMVATCRRRKRQMSREPNSQRLPAGKNRSSFSVVKLGGS